MSDEQARIIFDKLDRLETRVRMLEIRFAFGAGAVVAAQILIGVFL